jgi:hypothetical protein
MYCGSSPNPSVRRLLDLGVVMLASAPSDKGIIRLFPAGIHGPAIHTWEPVLGWIEQTTAQGLADVRAKLAMTNAQDIVPCTKITQRSPTTDFSLRSSRSGATGRGERRRSKCALSLESRSGSSPYDWMPLLRTRATFPATMPANPGGNGGTHQAQPNGSKEAISFDLQTACSKITDPVQGDRPRQVISGLHRRGSRSIQWSGREAVLNACPEKPERWRCSRRAMPGRVI